MIKTSKGREKNGEKKRERGSISVLLMVILLPLLVLECFVIDATRLVSDKRLASDAGDLALNAVLASYNRELYNGYSLFAVDERVDVTGVASESFNRTVNSKPGVVSGGSTFLKMDAAVDVYSYPASALGNDDVFKGQIFAFMKYYGNQAIKKPEYLYKGMDQVDSMIQVIEDKLRCDYLLYKIHSESVDVTGLTDSYDSMLRKFRGDVNNLNISTQMRTYMNEQIAAMPTVDGIKESLRVDASSSGIKPAYRDVLIGLFAYGNADNNSYHLTQWNGEMLPEHTAGTFEVPLESVVEAHLNEDKFIDSFISNLKQIAARYSNYNAIKRMVSDDFQEDVIIEEYISGLFSAFTRRAYAINGSRVGESGMVNRVILGAEQEYIAFGRPHPYDNLKLMTGRMYEFVFLWDIFHAFSCNRSIQSSANLLSIQISDGRNLATSFYNDLALIGYTCMTANKQMDNLIGDGRFTSDVSTLIFRGGELELISSFDLLKLFFLYEMEGKSDYMLARVKTLIEANMRASGHPGFSLDQAFAMYGIDAKINATTVFIPGVSFTYSSYAGY